MPFVVIQRDRKYPDMHVVNWIGSLSFHGEIKKFKTKRKALEIAQMWADINAECGHSHKKMIVKEVP